MVIDQNFVCMIRNAHEKYRYFTKITQNQRPNHLDREVFFFLNYKLSLINHKFLDLVHLATRY